jgi:hypothetical protein
MRSWTTSAFAAFLFGLALHVTATGPVSAQSSPEQRAAPQTGPGETRNRAPGSQQEQDNSEAEHETEGDSTAPGAGGCPFFQRKLQLIV